MGAFLAGDRIKVFLINAAILNGKYQTASDKGIWLTETFLSMEIFIPYSSILYIVEMSEKEAANGTAHS